MNNDIGSDTMNTDQINELAARIAAHDPTEPLPDDLANQVLELAEDKDLQDDFRAALRARFQDPATREDLLRWFDVDEVAHAITEHRIAEEYDPKAGARGVLGDLSDIGVDFARDVAAARERSLLGNADTLLLRGGKVAAIRLDAFASSLASAVFQPIHRLRAATERAFKALLLPNLTPGGVLLAGGGAGGVSVFAIDKRSATDPRRMGLVEIENADVAGVDGLRLTSHPRKEGHYILAGEPEVTLNSKALPEGTFDGGGLLVVFPLRAGRDTLRYTAGARMEVLDDQSGPAGEPRVRFRASIEECFQAPRVERPRLDVRSAKVVLVPREIRPFWE